jgi:hypothetical protein
LHQIPYFHGAQKCRFLIILGTLSTPLVPNQWQRDKRAKVCHPPIHAPWRLIASLEYSEQEGLCRHLMPKKVIIGDKKYL